jgi:hypothetical protein
LLCPCWAKPWGSACLVFSNTHSSLGISFCKPWLFSPLRENWILQSKMNDLFG